MTAPLRRNMEGVFLVCVRGLVDAILVADVFAPAVHQQVAPQHDEPAELKGGRTSEARSLSILTPSSSLLLPRLPRSQKTGSPLPRASHKTLKGPPCALPLLTLGQQILIPHNLVSRLWWGRMGEENRDREAFLALPPFITDIFLDHKCPPKSLHIKGLIASLMFYWEVTAPSRDLGKEVRFP